MVDREGRVGAVCGVGGGIFAKTAKTPPLQSALRGMALPDLYARAGINRNGVGG